MEIKLYFWFYNFWFRYLYALFRTKYWNFFSISLGVLVGIALGATAIGVPVSEVGKHFPNENRTIATGIVTAAASVGYFLSPLFTKYSLQSVGWEQTLKYFLIFHYFCTYCINFFEAFRLK